MKRLTLTHVMLALAFYELFLKPKPPVRGDVAIGDAVIGSRVDEWDNPYPIHAARHSA